MPPLTFLEKPKTFTITERVDPAKVDELLKIKDFSFLKKESSKSKDTKNIHVDICIKNIKKLAPRGNLVKKFKQNDNFGRYYYDSDIDPYGVLYMPNAVRSFILPEGTRDLDISNCHPTILNTIFSMYGLECPGLKQYIEDRQAFLDTNKISKEEFLIMINDKNLKTQSVKLSSIHTDIYRKLIPLMKKDHSDLFNKCKINHPTNAEGSFISRILQECEQDIMFVAMDYFNRNNILYGCLIYDGIHIYDQRDLNLDEICEEIFQRTKFRISFKFKDFDSSQIDEYLEKGKDDKELEPYDLVEKLFDLKKDFIKVCKNVLWIKHNDNVWYYDKELIDRVIVQWICEVDKYYTKGLSEHVKQLFKARACEKFTDDLFEDKFYESTKKILCFKNGYLKMDTKEFTEWKNADPEIYTDKMMPYDYMKSSPELRKEIYDKILNPIFNDDEDLRNNFLTYTAIALAGLTPKYFLAAEGERDSGKGVLTLLYNKSFSSYVGAMSNSNLIRKPSLEREERNTWMYPLSVLRLLMGNEIPYDDKARLDGTMIKTIASGGDEVQVKLMRENAKNVKIRANICMFQQQLPKFDEGSKDAIQNMLYFRFPCYFSDEKRENEYAIYKKADKSIKDFITTSGVKLYCAFVDIICDYLKPDFDFKLFKELAQSFKEDDDADEDTLFKEVMSRRFERVDKTDDKKDFVSTDQILAILKEEGIVMNNKKLKTRMTKEGFEAGREFPSRGKRGYRSLALKDSDEEE